MLFLRRKEKTKLSCYKLGSEHKFFKLLNDMGFVSWKAGKGENIHGLFNIHAKHPSKQDLNFWFQVNANWVEGSKRESLESEFPAGEKDFVCMVRHHKKLFEIKNLSGSLWTLPMPAGSFLGSCIG